MTALTAKQLTTMIRLAQAHCERIEHEQYDTEHFRYRISHTEMWQRAAKEAVPENLAEWRDMVRVLAQGEGYYDGKYDG
jgi:hypothetical protein